MAGKVVCKQGNVDRNEGDEEGRQVYRKVM